jgi:hypothetical protein
MRQGLGVQPSYKGLRYADIRKLHDRIYFGKWRELSGTDADLEEAWRQLQQYVRLLSAEVGPDAPSDQRDYLVKARVSLDRSDPSTTRGSELLQAMNATLSYGHSVLNLLLRSRGEANHISRDFAPYYGLGCDVDE